MKGLFDVVKCLVDHGADIEGFSGNLQNSLQIATINGHLNVVKYLVEKGANLEATPDINDKTTALHYAAVYYKLDVLEYLIGKGANIETKDGTDLTPLANTAWRGLFDVVKCLVDHGADINTKVGAYGKNGIHYMISSNDGKLFWGLTLFQDYYQLINGLDI
jgi:ankyrin repeat protein